MIHVINKSYYKAHVIYQGTHYVISTSKTRGDTAIFLGNPDGSIKSYIEYGAADSIDDAIDNFKRRLHPWM